MRRILTILTVASLFAVVSASAERAQAEEVLFTGTVPTVCTIESKTDGTLKVNDNAKPTKLVTNTPGEVKVFCNTATSTLNIGTVAPTNIYNQTAFGAKFNGGTGVYSSAAGASVSPGALVNSDTAKIDATIGDGTTPLAASVGAPYKLTITPTLVP